ncbi:hypothetical protein BKA62DRAFT_822090 [Auriculariales sp. MPI-PUGE-AT-0066]|nr:hypothetical protein BKA62DRAFT_822090 [Auriculariales sp. MPI-PUGE-AT-0066]
MPSMDNHPAIVKEAISAQKDVLDTVKAGNSCKEDCRKIAKVVQHIVTCVENSSSRAHHDGRGLVISLPARCALDVTIHQFPWHLWAITKKKETSTIILNYLVACHALSDILQACFSLPLFDRSLCAIQAENDKCGLLEEDLDGAGRELISRASKKDLELEVENLSPAYDGIKAMIRGMVNMTEGLPWPLKAVPQTFLQIVQHLEKGQAVAAGVTQLLAEVQAHWDLVAQFHAPGESNEKLSAHVATFFEVLFSVFIRLRVLQVAHPVASRIAVDSYNAALSEESQRVASAMRALESARDWTASNDIADVKKELQILNQSGTTYITIDLDICSAPPPKPNVFHGRDDCVKSLVEKAIEHSTQQAAANLDCDVGAPDCGTLWFTSVFLSCEPLIDVTGVGAALGKLFDIPASKDILQGIITHLESHSRTLLVLDNLETVWLVPNDRARSQLELLLRRLAAIPTLTLIITSRGIVLPRGIRWANVASATLEPFSAEAALRTFDDIAGTSENDEENERAAVMELMRDVDYMPLAVTLLAQLAQCDEKPSVILRHWKKSHTTMLRSDPLAHGRETSVAASIAVSIKLLTAGSDSEEPLQLLSICAHLPAGLRTSVFHQLMPHFKNLDSARRSLKTLALISVGPQEELRMLSPIRHYVLSAHPMTANHHAVTRQIYFEIAASVPTKLSEEFTTKSTAVEAEYENLNVFLLHLINTEEPSESLVDAVSAVLNMHTGHLHRPLSVWPCGAASMVTHSGWRTSDALLQASEIWKKLGDRQDVAYCAYLLGACEQAQGFYEVAVQQYTAARDTFLEVQNHSIASRCLLRLGEIAYAKKNTKMPSSISHPRGEIFTQEGNFAMAETEIQTAHFEYQAIGAQSGRRQCMVRLGDLRRRQQDFSSAEELLVSARERLTRVGNPVLQAICIASIGLLRRDQGRTQEALEAFRTAAQVFERMGAAGWLEKCRLAIEGLGNVEM